MAIFENIKVGDEVEVCCNNNNYVATVNKVNKASFSVIIYSGLTWTFNFNGYLRGGGVWSQVFCYPLTENRKEEIYEENNKKRYLKLLKNFDFNDYNSQQLKQVIDLITSFKK